MVEQTQETDPKADPPQDNGSLEARAKRMGWKAEEDWRGDPPEAGFLSAEDFVARGETELPILQERFRKQDGDLVAANKRITELSSTLEKLGTHLTTADKRAHDRAVQELEAKQRKAVEDGDTDAFDAAAKERDKLDKQTEAPAPDPAPKADPSWDAWAADNKWYGDDVEMTVYAEQAAPTVQKKTQYIGRALYDAITAEVKKKYPARFGNPRRDDPPSVEGGGRPPGGGGKGRKYADLPPDAKAACDDFVRDLPDFTRKDYLDTYGWSE